MKHFIIVLLITFGFIVQVFTKDKQGGLAGAFLRRGVSSRALSMGSAYTGIANDVSAIYWNPAGLAQTKKREFISMYSVISLDRQHIFTAFSNNFSDYFTIGVGWLKFGVADVEDRDNDGNLLNKFNDSENCFLLSIGKRIGKLSIGFSGKYIYHSLYNNVANGVSFDFGANAQLFDFISIGLMLQDIQGKLKWNTNSNLQENIPLYYRAGLAFHPHFIPLIISADVHKISGGNFIYCFGGEYFIFKSLGIRTGFDGNHLTFGGIVNVPLNYVNIGFDYAMTFDQIDNESIHHISLLINF